MEASGRRAVARARRKVRLAAARAVEAFQKSVDAEPTNAVYHYHLGLAYLEGGQPLKARQVLQHALQIAPNFPQAAEARKALNSLGG